jgi:hypothetical protein
MKVGGSLWAGLVSDTLVKFDVRGVKMWSCTLHTVPNYRQSIVEIDIRRNFYRSKMSTFIYIAYEIVHVMFVSQLLYDSLFTANQFVLAPSPSRLTTSDCFSTEHLRS